MSSSLCKNLEGAIFPLQVEAVEDRVDDAVHAFDIHQADHRPVRRRTSTNKRSMTFVVRNLGHGWRGKLKNDSSSGKSFSNCRTGDDYYADLHDIATAVSNPLGSF